MSSAALMPDHVGVRFAHATVQAIADSVGVEVLHIKGPAVHPSLPQRLPRPTAEGGVQYVTEERRSTDADVLVRPGDVARLIKAMRQHGWKFMVDFADGSAFEHAATMGHDRLAHVDVHRSFPGFSADPEQVFRSFWRHRQSLDIAAFPCAVPDPTAQRLLLIINAVRDGEGGRPEIERLWNDADTEERQAVQRLAHELGAEVALAAATGNLDAYAGSREHRLWTLLSTGQGTSVDLWLARVRAQPTGRAALREAVKLVIPNARRLAVQIGRPLTRREIASAWNARLAQGLHGIRVALVQRTKRGRR